MRLRSAAADPGFRALKLQRRYQALNPLLCRRPSLSIRPAPKVPGLGIVPPGLRELPELPAETKRRLFDGAGA